MTITLQKIPFLKYYCFRNWPGTKGNCVPKGFPIGFKMAEKNVYRKTDRQTDMFVFI